ncbi:cytochrome P450 [Gigaspora rosea]|uniref:Cytochrome P450 n=1 Tax=Gigaspora rosea TaxID=44941 RepID=A0A397TRM6_9GLOM|nr:cytochrome P450 [Gigaspora rosea]
MYYYLIATFAFVGYIFYKCYIHPLYLSPLRKIPGPSSDNFIFGHHASFLNFSRGEAFASLTKKYGRMFRYHSIFNQPHVVITDPTLAQQILITRTYDYPNFFLSRNLTKDFIGEGVTFTEGDDHKRQRKALGPSFSLANVKEMLPTFFQASHKMKDIWLKQIGNKKEERITITDLVPKIILDVIGLVGFNYEFNATSPGSEIAQAYHSIVNIMPPAIYVFLADFLPVIRKILPSFYKDQYLESVQRIHNISDMLVSNLKNANIRGNDIMSILVKTNENLRASEQLTYDEMYSQVIGILIAGHETTSVALSWTLYYLAKCPEVQDRLRKEILDVFTDNNYFPTFEEIDSLEYLECVLKETLRKAPPLPDVMRSTSKDEIMNGYIIPKGTPLLISFYAIHHDPLIWGNDAENFNPSRWLDPEIKSNISTSAFLPFSAGRRGCPGSKMALIELKMIVPIIIRNFNFRMVEGFTFETRSQGFFKPVPGIDLLVSKVDY